MKPISIVMPVMNQLDWTRRCVDSILKNTSTDFEFVIIDNASTDGTKEYLEDLAAQSTVFKVIRNEVNRGVSASWNQGVEAACHDYVCVINNDIEILTPNWLTHMYNTLVSKDTNRWVSPRTCYDKKKIDFYKKSHYEQLVYNPMTPDRYVVGCCFLCPKSVFTELGPFDEGFEIRYYEDLDYLAQILSARLTVEMCIYVVILHGVGTTSRITKGGDLNYLRYEEKWGKSRYSLDFWRGKY